MTGPVVVEPVDVVGVPVHAVRVAAATTTASASAVARVPLCDVTERGAYGADALAVGGMSEIRRRGNAYPLRDRASRGLDH